MAKTVPACRSAATSADVAAALEQLTTMPAEELKAQWQALYGAPPPKNASRDLLTRAIAYKLQEAALGGLSSATRRRLLQIAADLKTKGDAAITTAPRLKPGTRLVRVWKGEVHEVTVLAQGFAWRGERFGSLSQIARTITGTRWNGWTFFALKQTSRAARQQNGPEGAGPSQAGRDRHDTAELSDA